MTNRVCIAALVAAAACRPTAPPHYAPTVDEMEWERCHQAEDASDLETALDGYAALCNRPSPYVRGCFDHARLMFDVRPIDEARRATCALVIRFPDHGLSQSAVKRLARSYRAQEAHSAGIAALAELAKALEETELYDTVLFEMAGLAREAGDVEREQAYLETLISKHGRWESQLWDDAIWRLSEIARKRGDSHEEKQWLRTLLNADETSWLIGSYTSPFYDDALLRLGWMLMAESRPEAAAEVFDIAAALKTSRLVVDALLGAAEARITLGRQNQACQILAKITSQTASRRQITQSKILSKRAGCIRK